jgi:hypothetical protein
MLREDAVRVGPGAPKKRRAPHHDHLLVGERVDDLAAQLVTHDA